MSYNPFVVKKKKTLPLLLDSFLALFFRPLVFLLPSLVLWSLFRLSQEQLTLRGLDWLYPLLVLTTSSFYFLISTKILLPWHDSPRLISGPLFLWRGFLLALTVLALYGLSAFVLGSVYEILGALFLSLPALYTFAGAFLYLIPLSLLIFWEAEISPLRCIILFRENSFLKSLQSRGEFLMGNRKQSILLSLVLTLLFWASYSVDFFPPLAANLPPTLLLTLRILQIPALVLPALAWSSFYLGHQEDRGDGTRPPLPKNHWYNQYNT